MSVELVFRNPIFIRIPDSLSRVVDSKAENSGFHEKKITGFWNSDYLTWGGSLYTYPSPKPTLILTSHLGQNVGLGKG